MLHDEVIAGPAGRKLAIAQWGDPTGLPVIYLHGTPGCRLSVHPDEALVAATQCRVITYDRPGYGMSERDRGRTVASCAADVEAIADHLELGRFAVVGRSGGGPHALAAAALLADRVVATVCEVGLAPIDALGAHWAKDMDPENIAEYSWALEGESRLLAELERIAGEASSAGAGADLATILANFDLPESDRATLAGPVYRDLFAQAGAEQFRHGLWGWVDDDLAHVAPWGFDLFDIVTPVQVRYGMADVVIPPAHGAWLVEHIPGAVAVVSDFGHLGSPASDLVERHAWLRFYAGGD